MLQEKSALLVSGLVLPLPLYLRLQLAHVAMLPDPAGRCEQPVREDERSLQHRGEIDSD